MSCKMCAMNTFSIAVIQEDDRIGEAFRGETFQWPLFQGCGIVQPAILMMYILNLITRNLMLPFLFPFIEI